MYTKIKHPVNNKTFSIFSNMGKQLINNYQKQFNMIGSSRESKRGVACPGGCGSSRNQCGQCGNYRCQKTMCECTCCLGDNCNEPEICDNCQGGCGELECECTCPCPGGCGQEQWCGKCYCGNRECDCTCDSDSDYEPENDY